MNQGRALWEGRFQWEKEPSLRYAQLESPRGQGTLEDGQKTGLEPAGQRGI